MDVPADVPGMEVDSAVPGTEDTEPETDSPSSELSGTDTVTPWLRMTWINSALLNLPSLK